MAAFGTILPVWSRTEPFNWASAALTCAQAALQERRRTNANKRTAKQRFIVPPMGAERSIRKGSLEQPSCRQAAETIRLPHSARQLSIREMKCQELNFNVKAVLGIID
jgi:hypothetical protein